MEKIDRTTTLQNCTVTSKLQTTEKKEQRARGKSGTAITTVPVY